MRSIWTLIIAALLAAPLAGCPENKKEGGDAASKDKPAESAKADQPAKADEKKDEGGEEEEEGGW